MTRRFGLLALLLLPACAAAPQAAGQGDTEATIVFLVRHAEKASETADDPELSAVGRARAAALAVALADARISGVIVTQRRRSGETAAPLARALGIVPDTVALGGTGAEHAAAVAARIREMHRGGTVLVVGHSNTVPAIMTALGGTPLPDLCDSAYAHLFMLVLRPGVTQIVRGHFGAADPPGAENCRGMHAR